MDDDSIPASRIFGISIMLIVIVYLYCVSYFGTPYSCCPYQMIGFTAESYESYWSTKDICRSNALVTARPYLSLREMNETNTNKRVVIPEVIIHLSPFEDSSGYSTSSLETHLSLSSSSSPFSSDFNSGSSSSGSSSGHGLLSLSSQQVVSSDREALISETTV